MSRLRITLGVLLVMIGLVSASHPVLVGDLLANLAAASQTDDSNDDSGSEAVSNCDGFTVQNRLTAPVPIRKLEKTVVLLTVQSPPGKSAAEIEARPAHFLIATSACLARSGLLPRAPSPA